MPCPSPSLSRLLLRKSYGEEEKPWLRPLCPFSPSLDPWKSSGLMEYIGVGRSLSPSPLDIAPLPPAMTVAAVPPVLSAVGFTATGITASSLAAKMMSLSAIANGGGVPAGGLVAILQSAGKCHGRRTTGRTGHSPLFQFLSLLSVVYQGRWRRKRRIVGWFTWA